jgi:hypothetical protein
MPRHLLVTNDYPPKTGGIQVYLHELWRRLEPQRAVVLTATSAPDTESFDAASEIVVERIPAKTLFLPTIGAPKAPSNRRSSVTTNRTWCCSTRRGRSVCLGPRLSVPYGVSCTAPR